MVKKQTNKQKIELLKTTGGKRQVPNIFLLYLSRLSSKTQVSVFYLSISFSDGYLVLLVLVHVLSTLKNMLVTFVLESV